MSTPIMRDRDIRATLRLALRSHFDCRDTLFIDELGLCQGNARIDIAVVNGTLNGYEIKSEADTLYRLPHQVVVYSKILDYVSIVASSSHIEKASKFVPEWWGMTEVIYEQDHIAFKTMREAQCNPAVDPFALAQLLWRNETLAVLNRLGITKGLSGKPRQFLWQKLVDSQTLEELKTTVRTTLKVREGWRSDQLQTLGDDLFQFVAM